MRIKVGTQHLIVAVAYAVLVLLYTYPLVTQLTTHVPGELTREDFWVHLWTFDWVRDAFLTGQSPYYTNRIFYPNGVSLVSHNIAWLNIAIWLPLQVIVGEIAAYNLVFLLIYWLNCWSGFLFAHAETKSTLASFLAGLTFGFWPYVVSHFDHPNLIFIAWIPLSMLALHRIFVYKRKRDALFLTFFLAMLGITRWQLLVIGGFAIGGYLLYCWWQSGWSRRGITLALASGLAAGVLLLPLAWFMLQSLAENKLAANLLYHQTDSGQADLLAFVLPSRFHPLWGAWVQQTAVFANFTFNKFYTPTLLFSALPWVVLGLRQRKTAWLWGSIGVLYFLLSLGSVLRVNGQLYPQIPLPYRLIEDNIFIELVRRPGRYNILLGLPMALLLAHGMAWLLPALSSTKQRSLWAFAAILLLFEMLSTPFPLVDTRIVPPGYAALPPAETPYAIVTVPLTRIPTKLAMFYQLSHDFPLVGGQIARRTADTYSFIDGIPFLASLRQDGTIPDTAVAVSQQLARLTAVNVQYLVAQKQGLDHHHTTNLRNWLPYAPFYEDDELVIYTTQPRRNEQYAWQADVASGMGLVQTRLLRADNAAGIVVIRMALDAEQPPLPGQRACLRSDLGLVACQPLQMVSGLQHAVVTLPTEAAFTPAYAYIASELGEPVQTPVQIVLEWPYRPGD